MSWASRYIDKLRQGEIIRCYPSGNSMTPRIKSGQLCVIAPVLDIDDLRVGDVVLCTVRGKDYLHLVKATGSNGCLIGNNHGRINGWTRDIHGILIGR